MQSPCIWESVGLEQSRFLRWGQNLEVFKGQGCEERAYATCRLGELTKNREAGGDSTSCAAEWRRVGRGIGIGELGKEAAASAEGRTGERVSEGRSRECGAKEIITGDSKGKPQPRPGHQLEAGGEDGHGDSWPTLVKWAALLSGLIRISLMNNIEHLCIFLLAIHLSSLMMLELKLFGHFGFVLPILKLVCVGFFCYWFIGALYIWWIGVYILWIFSPSLWLAFFNFHNSFFHREEVFILIQV